MEKAEDHAHNRILAEDLLQTGHIMLEQLSEISSKHKIEGMAKLKKRVIAEVEFMDSLVKAKEKLIKKNQVVCSNLIHYKAIIDRVMALGPQTVVGVLRSVHLPPQYGTVQNGQPKRVDIDLITQRGACWIKVKAMKAASVHSIFLGSSTMGHKSVLETAKEMIICANNNLVNYVAPVVVFHFAQGVTDEVKMRLLELGARVEGQIVEPDDEEEYDSDEDDDGSEEEADSGQKKSFSSSLAIPESYASDITIAEPTVANLDVTTLICLVSDVTNGGSHHNFTDPVLLEQAMAERQSPSLPALLKVLEGKRLICTQTAFKHFMNIANIVGGPEELKRAEEWRAKIDIVDDEPSDLAKKLTGPKIKEQHKIVFGTGDRYKAVTTTSNSALVRSAEHQGVKFCVYIHPARALTEQKAMK